MSDTLLDLSRSRAARSVARTFGVSLPPTLVRDPAPWSELLLQDQVVGVLAGPGAALAGPLAGSLARFGATVQVEGAPGAFAEAAEAWARPLTADPEARPWALVVDASGVEDVEGLRFLWEAVAPRLRSLRSSGRVVLVARPADAGLPGAAPIAPRLAPATAAARRAVDGYMRSLARELGRTGATANLVLVPEGSERELACVLPFLLSPRSAYVSGQPWRLAVPEAALAGQPPGPRPFAGRVALVTGAARGIGEATARALAREGARVLVHDHPGSAEDAQALATALGGRAVLADLATREGRDTLVAAVGDRLDVVVQNAGVTRDKTLGRMSAEQWDLVLAVNLAAVLDLAERLGPRLATGGAMVCLSSIGGLGGNVGQTNYAATKAGVAGLVQALAPQLAAQGVSVAAVAPGFIETRMTAAIPFATREVARRLANVSQGGLPEDVAEVIVFLASPAGRALRGQALRVCGGNLLGA